MLCDRSHILILKMMPSANLEKHHGFPPPPPGFLCLTCIKFWRLLRLLGPEHLIPGRGWCGGGVLHTTKGSLLSPEGRGGQAGCATLTTRTFREWRLPHTARPACDSELGSHSAAGCVSKRGLRS
ncbi:hypothetical protein mRhiFer1_009903 [Rhinolophus ferrumequinum]|uniref:Uncharacterized protein n=1 Tax=Rhinolophus ferrumequinum TaxID=59479 RepID=A0A7J7YIJ3_RHIFE|nr:hypothetical protein mRhiFer1_009903 [Rhinolophus ferrumequinum]